MYHASFAFRDDLLLFAEVGATLLAALVVLWRPRRLERPLRRAWRRLAAVPARRAVWASGVVALLASLASMLWLAFPVPITTDEFGYLLIGDTVAHGRLTNPMPAVPAAFEAVHTLVRPSYSTKYPPAHGTWLALGQLLGHPGLGVCLAAGVLGAAACWFLQGWLPPPWPLLGAALLSLRVGVGSYWGQSYWGGATTALGGLLLYGALPRLYGRRARLAWLPIAGGVFLLANSRPLEGAVAALPAALLVGIALLRHRRRWWPAAGALTLALAAGALATAAYNRAVTGDALRLPYQLHIATSGMDAASPYVAPPPPVRYSSPVLAAHLAKEFPRPRTWGEALAKGGSSFARMTYFVGGLPLLACFVLALCPLPRGRRHTPWKAFALLCCVLPAALHSVTAWWGPHYSAAATGPLLLLAMFGMREASATPWRGRRLGPWLAAAALAVRVPLTVAELPAFRPDPGTTSRFAGQLERRFATSGRRGLVVVDDRLRAKREWVINRADLDRAPLLWIQDLGPGVTREVAAAYAPREVYRLVPGAGIGAPPRLIRAW